jgi:protein phosphatase
VHILNDATEVEEALFERTLLWSNRRSEHGPFDIIGDVHGCFDELVELLNKLGYDTKDLGQIVPPAGRKAVFVGDLVDRGPKVVEVLSLVSSMVSQGTAICVPGNHDAKLVRKLRGRDVQVTHGLAETLQQLQAVTAERQSQFADFLDKLVSHYVLDEGRLVVAHAGMKQQYIGRSSKRVREFALYGETTGETDDCGLPVRHNWAAEYRGRAIVVYGHTPVLEPDWLNNTINIDTGCVFGGKLTALRYPERELVSVLAREEYAVPARPLVPIAPAALSIQQQHDDMLDIEDVLRKRIIETELMRGVTVREENAAAALEVMSRFAIDPRWLIYLPPTISPTETSAEPGLLEHPREAFDYYRAAGVEQVICEEKHMGSRAVVIVCKNESVAAKRFGFADIDSPHGIIYTRTGRRFFENRAIESELLQIVAEAATRTNLWEELGTDWLCLDCELMPWSAKAQDLLRKQYAAVGAAATAALADVNSLLSSTAERYPGGDIQPLIEQYRQRQQRAEGFVQAYSVYCWRVASVADLKLAPFHLLASEGSVHTDKDHSWHMRTLARLAGPSLVATRHQLVDVKDAAAVEAGIGWWQQMTDGGGEGMVVKPLSFITNGPRGLVQPAMKCRGKEYLRIIYGPEYDAPENLVRLRKRGLAAKRSLALREFALGIESLKRFVKREPLRRVHECVFGVLALESEPVDSRL